MKLKNLMKKATLLVVSAAILITSTVTAFGFGAAYDKSDVRSGSIATAEKIQAEGTVLLSNNGALPLDKNTKVNFFGAPSVAPVIDGGGSGKIRVSDDVYYDSVGSINSLFGSGHVFIDQMYDVLEKEFNIEANPKLKSFYHEWFKLNYTESAYSTTVIREADSGNLFGTAASMKAEPPFAQLLDPSLGLRPIVKEGNSPVFDANGDPIYDMTAAPKGEYSQDYSNLWDNAVNYSDTAVIFIGRAGSESADLKEYELRMRKAEVDLIKNCKENFDKVIVVFNTCNVMEMAEIEEYDVDAALMVWATGEWGLSSVGRILGGAINPSGKLASTISYKIADHPSSKNFGDYRYTNTETNVAAQYYLQYEEGIYVGNRYFETFNQTDKVQYPFGYGLSYTTFTQSAGNIVDKGSSLSIDVTVTNTGAVAGKDVVELYMTAPYSNGGIEKARNVLVGYEKTGELAPGVSETVTIEVDKYDMASYDMKSNECFVVEEGTYTFRVMTSLNAKNINDNVVASRYYEVNNAIIYKEDPVSGYTVQNQFADAIKGNPDGSAISILSRANHDGTYPTAPADADNIRSAFLTDRINAYPDPVTEGEEFKFGVVLDEKLVLQDIYKDAARQLKLGNYDTMDDALWESGLWNDFISQLTFSQVYSQVINCGYRTYGLPTYGINATVDNDGPQQIKGGNAFDSSYPAGTAFPITSCLTCTWNKDLANEMGKQVGKDAAVIGVQAWYAPGNNLHRSPMGGRNFEYYSEDPFLAGEMCAKVVAGARSEDLTVTVKHFAVNDCEQNRGGVLTFANEQSIRELYLRPFEKAVKIGGARGIMSSYNRIGATWAGGHSGLLTEVLRGEWGFRGYVVTDYLGDTSYMIPALAIYAQNDGMLQLFGVNSSTIAARMTSDPIGMSNALARSIKNLCYYKLHALTFEMPAKADAYYMGLLQEWYTKLVNEKTTAVYANIPTSAKALYENYLDDINMVLMNDYATADEITEALAKTGEAYDLLGLQLGDKTILSSLVSTYSAIDLSLYRTIGQSTFLAALDKARGLLNSEVFEDEIQSMVSELVAARNALRLLANRSALEFALQTAQGLKLSDYTDESVANSNIVFLIGQASNLLKDPDAEQDDINNTEKGIWKAMDTLVKKTPAGGDGSSSDDGDNSTSPSDSKGTGSKGTGSKADNTSAPKTGEVENVLVFVFIITAAAVVVFNAY